MGTNLKVGLVGIGGMGGCHFSNYDDVQGAEIVAVCDVQKEMALKKVEGRKINVYTDINKMLKKEDLDIIDICTPSYLHRDMAIKLLKKGYHVLCEKPMTLSYMDAKRVLAVVNTTEKNFMVAHVVRFMAPYAFLREEMQKCELGKLLRLDMKRISSIPTWSWEDWMRNEKLSGGVITDLSIHDLDFVQSILGMPDKVEGYRYRMKDNNDTAFTTLIYGDTLVTCEGTWYNTEVPFCAEFSAIFQNGSIELKGGKLYKNGKEVAMKRTEKDGKSLGINISNDNGYLNEIQYFVDCVKKNEKPSIVTPLSSAKSIELADMIKRKAKVLNKK